MNKDEWTSLVTVIVAMVGPQAVKYGLSTTDLTNALMGVFAVAMVVWTIWHNWNLRKVPETAIVVGHAPDVAAARIQSSAHV